MVKAAAPEVGPRAELSTLPRRDPSAAPAHRRRARAGSRSMLTAAARRCGPRAPTTSSAATRPRPRQEVWILRRPRSPCAPRSSTPVQLRRGHAAAQAIWMLGRADELREPLRARRALAA